MSERLAGSRPAQFPDSIDDPSGQEMQMNSSILISTQAEALFVSDLQPSQRPTSAQIRTAILRSLRRHRSIGCAALVAQEYGDHPGETIERMRWATAAVRVSCAVTGWGQRLPQRPVDRGSSSASAGRISAAVTDSAMRRIAG
jgi:hypothetical protein